MNMGKLSSSFFVGANIIAALSLSGCARLPGPSLISDPYTYSGKYPGTNDIVLTHDDAGLIDAMLDTYRNGGRASLADRNNFITTKMFLIDKAYWIYEEKLTRDDQTFNLAATLTTLGLTTAASAIPAGQTTKLLAAAATAVGAGTAAYDKELLLSQAIQAIQSQMRTDRANVAARILSRMTSCSEAGYPVGLIYADLEAYERAGTLASAMIGLQKTVAAAQSSAEGAKLAAGGGNANVTTLVSALGTAQKLSKELEYLASCPVGQPLPKVKGSK